MKKVRLTNDALKIIVDEIGKNLVDNYISLVYMINSTDLIMSFSRLRKGFLYVSLNNNNPYISLVGSYKNPIKPISSKYNDYLKKYIKDSHIENIKQLNKDRILEIEIEKANQVFEREKYFVVIEFVSRSTNLIILNSERKIVYAFKYKSLDNPHPILNGLVYECPKTIDHVSEEVCFDDLSKYGESLYGSAIEKKRKELFKPLYQHLTTRINQLDRKIFILQNEIKECKNIDKNIEIGNTLLTFNNDESSLKEYLQKSHINYDSSISVIDNANHYFKKYKKEKKKLQENEKQIAIAETEYEDLSIKLNMCDYLSEDELQELSNEFLKKKVQINKQKKLMYPQISLNGTMLYFGKNAEQNNNLSFKFAHKDWMFFHIKDYHGPHIVLANNNPNKELLELASKITLILSNKNIGEVNCAKIEDIKKGQFPGQVLFKKYTTISIKNIEQEVYDLIKKN